ncbi:MAG: hypothetical protein JWM58_2539 [Rhizobium sp.]|nr:hypothetical protein [Rhizobium sp.]
MSELADLLRQKAEIDAKIEKVKAAEVDRMKLQFCEMATQLRELSALPSSLVTLFTDKAGTFNAYRVLKVKKA